VVKRYYLTYAIKATDLDEISQRIGRLLAMKVVPRTGSYAGDYVSCEGASADRLTVTQRNRKYFPPEMDYRLYGLMLFAQNIVGKNADKEGRHNGLKAKLAKLKELTLLEETIEESEN
jgi:hypothetical protein